VIFAGAIFGLVIGGFWDRLSTVYIVLLGVVFVLLIAVFWMIPSLRRLRHRYETDPLRAKRQT
jgi:membrane protein YdbS with pleckstrin-like domain